MLLAEVIDTRGVFDELVGPADADHRCVNPFLAEEFEHRTAVAAHEHVVFERDDDFRHVGELFGEFRVNRLGEARIDDGAVETFGGELSGGLLRDGLHVAERKERDLVAA